MVETIAKEEKKHHYQKHKVHAPKAKELAETGTPLVPNPNIKKLRWNVKSSLKELAERDDDKILNELAVTPAVSKIKLKFHYGLEIPVMNVEGVTIDDVVHKIHKQFRHAAEETVEEPVLSRLEWDAGTERKPRDPATWEEVEVILAKK